MLSDPRLGPVWLAPECTAMGQALSAVGVEVVADPDNAAVAFVGGPGCDLDEIESTLPRGTLVWIAVAGADLRGSRRGPGWRVGEQLEQRSWQLLARIWAAGGIDAAFAYVDLDDSRAVRYLLRTAHRRGIRARLRGTAGLMLARLRLWRVLCREGYVVARTPT